MTTSHLPYRLAPSVVIAMTLVLAACGDKTAKEGAASAPAAMTTAATAATPGRTVKAALTVTTTQAQTSDLSVTVGANGNIAAWQEASVGTEANGLRLPRCWSTSAMS